MAKVVAEGGNQEGECLQRVKVFQSARHVHKSETALKHIEGVGKVVEGVGGHVSPHEAYQGPYLLRTHP
eukprot:CAMPEP_0114115498 /NCGR_PEP_ID=MMETSP0043_2-20121206/4003_1 /TAXON_ID=464988 /ORGANISM="Hemiselmis andersenii, Strain CCMP644" /LENGTH=68 /DNA_ID=CAMNT_0001207769 /DNA_START=44 /DNA_END=250 /DNA_ORIENTATION=+